MWFPKAVFDKFSKVLRLGSYREADEILVGVLEKENRQPTIPNVCPHCKKHLVRQALPYLELFVSGCPEKHGFWLSPENSLGLKRLVNEQLAGKSSSKQVLILLRNFLIGFAAVLAIHFLWAAWEKLQALPPTSPV